MNKEFEKIIEKLEEELKLADEEKLRCARENPLQFDSAKGYAHGVGRAIEIVKQGAEKYEECYKDCGDCEAYDKEKYHCPKFCKVITEAMKKIEENHNIKGKWEMTYKGMRKDMNTGLMISAYNCKCSVCGWETGNQGTRFRYCPNCGAKMDEVNKSNGA